MDRFFIENHSAMAGCSNLWCSNSSAPFYVTSKVATQLYPLVAEEWLRTVQLTPFSEKCTHCTATHYLQLKLLSGKNARAWDSMDFT